MSRRVLAKAGEIEPGECKIVTAMGREIGIFNVGGEYYALSNRCPHMGAELCKGWIVGLVEPGEPGQYKLVRQGEFLRCPWHGWEFDIRSGRSWCDPTRMRIRQYPVAVKPGTELVEGPYKAESFPVRVENNYVVVEA